MRTILLLCAFAVLLQCSMAAHSGKMVGGWTQHSVDDKDLQELSWRAMATVNEQSNDVYHMMPLKLLSAKSQVVAGTNYELEILMGQTSCMKNQVASTELSAANCKEKEGGRRQIVVVTVWQKPWENFEQITIKEFRAAS